MFHHLRRLGRGCAPPCRLCLRAFTACKAPAAPHPSVGCLGGPVLRLRRKTTRFPYASACVCDAVASHPHAKPCPALRRSAGKPGGLAPERQTGRGFAPHRAIPPHFASLRHCGGLLDGSPQQVATCTGAALPAPHQLGTFVPALVGPHQGKSSSPWSGGSSCSLPTSSRSPSWSFGTGLRSGSVSKPSGCSFSKARMSALKTAKRSPL